MDTSNNNNDLNIVTEYKDKPIWLDENLFQEFLDKKYPNFKKITKFQTVPAVATGENFMTITLRVKVEIEKLDSSQETTSFIIKIKPVTDAMQTMVRQWKVFEKELMTYNKYMPIFEAYYQKFGKSIQFAPNILIPRNVKLTEDVVILEDLSLKGFKTVKRQMGLDMEHTKAVLKKMSQFHAASAHYIQETGEEFPTIYDQCLVSETDSFGDFRESMFKIFRNNMHLYGDFKHLEEKLHTYVSNHFDPFQHRQRNANEFNVLNHGDLWINNILFQYAEDGSVNETYFVDFQLCRYGSPAQDLIYLIISSVNLENKITHFDYFIAYYHEQLSEHLKLLKFMGKIPSLRDIQRTLYEHDYWGYTVMVGLLPLVLCQSRDDAKVDNLLNGDENDLKNAMFCNANYSANVGLLLPWLENRGAFDL